MKNIEYNFCWNTVSIRTESRRAGRQKYLARGPFVLKESEDTPVPPDLSISQLFTEVEVNSGGYLLTLRWIIVLVYTTQAEELAAKSNFTCGNVLTKAILFFFGWSEMNRTLSHNAETKDFALPTSHSVRGWPGKNKAFCSPGTQNGRRVIKVYSTDLANHLRASQSLRARKILFSLLCGM